VLFFDFNIIFNLSHPSNHSQTLTNLTLNQPTFTFNPLKLNNTNFALYSTWIHLFPLPPMNRDGERVRGRGLFFYFSIIFVISWFKGDIKITIISAIYFSA